jgi:hypothetical protein
MLVIEADRRSTASEIASILAGMAEKLRHDSTYSEVVKDSQALQNQCSWCHVRGSRSCPLRWPFAYPSDTETVEVKGLQMVRALSSEPASEMPPDRAMCITTKRIDLDPYCISDRLFRCSLKLTSCRVLGTSRQLRTEGYYIYRETKVCISRLRHRPRGRAAVCKEPTKAV